MEPAEKTRLSAAELNDFFSKMFPHGLDAAEVIQEISPHGWENSPLVACFHPSPEQVLAELIRIGRNAQNLFGKSKTPDACPEPTMDEVMANWRVQPVNVVEEVTELVGRCIWDVFADNHDVIAADGRLVDLGSFRGASAFLDRYICSMQGKTTSGDDYRFYMGSVWISCRADLTRVYMMIFRRLKMLGAEWKYHFPRVYLVDLSPLRQAMEKEAATYSPSEAFAKEQQELEHQAELQRSRAELDEIYSQAGRHAMDRPPPETVRAYQQVYGRDPAGWPPLPGQNESAD